MGNYVYREFGDVGSIVENVELPDYPEVERPTDEELDADVHGLLKSKYLEADKARDRNIAEMRKKLKPLYATLYGQISD